MSGSLDQVAPDHLIHAGDVAELLGLAHRNSVSTYRSRYPDFPKAIPSPAGGRTLLWNRDEILVWRDRFAARRTEQADGASPRLDELVEATVRLMLHSGTSDVSIRQIASEAGVAHSDLYRYAASKDHLKKLAIDRINLDFADSMPDTYADLIDQVPTLLKHIEGLQPALVVIAEESLADPQAPPRTRIAVQRIAELLRDQRAQEPADTVHAIDPEIVAIATVCIVWGLNIFGTRWRKSLGLEDIDRDQVSEVIRTLLAI